MQNVLGHPNTDCARTSTPIYRAKHFPPSIPVNRVPKTYLSELIMQNVLGHPNTDCARTSTPIYRAKHFPPSIPVNRVPKTYLSVRVYSQPLSPVITIQIVQMKRPKLKRKFPGYNCIVPLLDMSLPLFPF
eukprot:sb/3475016/